MAPKKLICLGLLAIILVGGGAYLYYTQYVLKAIKWGEVVQTDSGSIRGIISKSRDGREFYSWLQIPYAQPPVGQLRFESPRPIQNWQEIRDGSQYGENCAQLNLFSAAFEGDEDCLFLNVHAPKVIPTGPLPVLVFIHGGSFVSGSAKDILPHYFMDEDVIMITLNYRVGVLGFLTTGDKHIRGNMGLKDQTIALKWIKKNVQYFGGNSNAITVAGISAGGAAVHYLTLSPTTRGLFSKAISMGGSALMPWSFSPTKKAIEKTKSLGRKLHCSVDNNYRLTECLQKFRVKELLSVYGKGMTEMWLFSPSEPGTPIVPTVEAVEDDEAFLTQEPYDVIVQGRQQRIPWMAGVVRDEGLLSTFEFYRNASALHYVEKNWDKCFQGSFSLTNAMTPAKATEVTRRIRDFYLPFGSADWSCDEKLGAYTRLYSDGFFIAGISEAAVIQRKFSPIFLYFYNRTGGPTYSHLMVHVPHPNSIQEYFISTANSIWNKIWGRKPRDYGIAHVEDGAMYFPMFPWMYIEKDESNALYKFSKDLVNLFVSYAIDETTMKFRNKKFISTPKNGALMYFKMDEDPRMISEPFSKRMEFWHSINYTQLFSSPKIF